MAEQIRPLQFKKFEGDPKSNYFKDRIKRGQSVFVGNPDENQFLTFTLLEFNQGTVSFKVTETNGESQYSLADQKMELSSRHKLEDAQLYIKWNKPNRKRSGSGLMIITHYGQNIDVVFDAVRKPGLSYKEQEKAKKV